MTADPMNRSIGDRWRHVVDDQRKQEKNRKDEERQARREQVHEVSLQNPLSDDRLRKALQAQPSTFQQEVGWDEGKIVKQERKPEASRTAPLPTPPDSPNASKTTTTPSETFHESDQHDVKTCRASIKAQQNLIESLQSQLEEKDAEFQSLQEELKQTLRQRRNAIHLDDDQEVEKLKKREEKLQGMLEEQEEMVSSLEKRIHEGKKRERDLVRSLDEAEGRIEEKERQLQKSEIMVDDAREPPSGGNRVNAKTGRRPRRVSEDKNWELRCKKGTRKSSFAAAWDVIKHS